MYPLEIELAEQFQNDNPAESQACLNIGQKPPVFNFVSKSLIRIGSLCGEMES